MIKKLKEKGFVGSEYDKEMLEGEFNGTDVYVHVVTNNNKVWRIAIEDVNVQDEYGIVLRFNRLCGQFENNRNYSKIDVDFRIPDYEDIEYEMTVNNKRYDAGFYQVPRDTMAIKSSLRGMMNILVDEEFDDLSEDGRAELAANEIMELLSKKKVWFMIDEVYGLYKILMFYDNEYNHANGEDL